MPQYRHGRHETFDRGWARALEPGAVDKRPWKTLAVAILAAIATVATSPPETSIRAREQGPRVELTMAAPSVEVPVEVTASSEASGAPVKWSRVSVEPVWDSDNVPAGDESPPRDVLEISIVDENGAVLAGGTGSSLRCDVVGCAAPAGVRFRLVNEEVARLIVNWELRVEFDFGEEVVPDNAEVGIEFADVETGATSVVVQGSLTRGALADRYGLGMTRIQIHSPGAIPPDSEISLEPVYARQDVRLHMASGFVEVEEGIAIPLDPPSACQTASCDWSVLLTGSHAEWQLVADPELGLKATAAPTTPIALISAPVSGQLEIEPGQPSSLTFRVEVDRSLVSGPDFEALGPLASIEVMLAWDDEEARVSVSGSRDSEREPAALTAFQPLDLICEGQTCFGMADVSISVPRDETTVGVDWEATVHIPYPITSQVPTSGDISIEVDGE